jgi:hypothetical protein
LLHSVEVAPANNSYQCKARTKSQMRRIAGKTVAAAWHHLRTAKGGRAVLGVRAVVEHLTVPVLNHSTRTSTVVNTNSGTTASAVHGHTAPLVCPYRHDRVKKHVTM